MEPPDEDNVGPGHAEIASGDTLRGTLSAAVSAPEMAIPAVQE